MKKITIHSEFIYVIAMILLPFSVGMVGAADFGFSMIVAPAFIVSQKFDFLTFGQAEWVVQGILFIIFCILMRRVRVTYFGAFLTALIYGLILDFWRYIVVAFRPEMAGDFAMPIRIAFFAVGISLSSFSIALFFKTYLSPEVYELFVKGLSEHFKVSIVKFKYCFDAGCFIIACVLTLVFFGKFDGSGIGIGTIVMILVNGSLIKLSTKFIDRFINIKPLFPKAVKYFE